MITKENINEALKKYHYDEIKEFFKNNNSAEERTEYVKKIYGIGGWSIPDRGNFIDYINYDLSGIEFIKRDINYKSEKIKLSWKKATTRLQEIIESESQISLF